MKNIPSVLAAACLLAGLASAVQGQELRAPRCADLSVGAFNGHPFIPLDCPENLEDRPDTGAPLAGSDLPPKKADKKLSDPGPLLGKWEGVVVFGNLRYEVFAQVEKVKGRTLEAVFQVKNYRTYGETAVYAKARPRWSRGKYDAEVRLLFWDGRAKPLKAGVRLGGLPAAAAEASRFDRVAVVSYEGKQGQHLVFLKPDGADRIVFQYEDRSGFFASEPIRVEGVLTRSQRDTL
ncbi:MAG: hypothetical protein HZB91_09490 [Elusimicrobia bacterium]|nr:hypothetical protein [Elusimicrobiota bacterium]